jgi:two-component system NarL family sensor kinase
MSRGNVTRRRAEGPRLGSRTSEARALIAFAVSGLLVLVLIGVAGVIVLQKIGADQATHEAERLVEITAHGVVEPRLTDGILRGDADSLIAIDTLVNGAVVREPISAVRILSLDGRVMYADDPALIGQRAADLPIPSPLSLSTRIATPDGTPLRFQAFLEPDTISSGARRLWTSFLPVLAVALVVLAALQVPLAYRLARTVRQSQEERERLLRHAIDASELERRRIAADLHDGSVQQLAGLSLSLAAKADELATSDPAASEALGDAAARTRQGMRSLRSAVMGISPPDLRRAGLSAALADLMAPLAAEGLQAELSVPERMDLPPDVEALLFRASREGIRNVVTHARAHHVRVTVTSGDGHATLEVRDDGVGIGGDQRAIRMNGHLGLRLLDELVADAGGSLDVASPPSGGTVFRVQVPVA